MFRFPGRAVLDRLLVLPLAIPAYILAYAYVEFLDFSGPVQSRLRGLAGWTSSRDYWFPDIRSLAGAIFVLSAALYPYVYLSARASFTQQSVCVLEVARTLGRTSLGAFWSVALPLARPALAAGAALVAMECLNDFGAMQYLGVQTLTVSIYATWLQRGSLSGAAQLSLVLLIVVFALIMAERVARHGQRFHHTTGRYRAIPFQHLHGVQAVLAQLACGIPVLFGFGIPVAVLGTRAYAHLDLALAGGFWHAAGHSIVLAAVAAAIAVLVGLVLAYARRTVKSGLVPATTALAGVGYAIPGTVLALGLMLPLAGFDNLIVIQHDDGTTTLYGHLTHDGAAVRRAAYEASGFVTRRALDAARAHGGVTPKRIVVVGPAVGFVEGLVSAGCVSGGAVVNDTVICGLPSP